MDLSKLLEADHRKVEELFTKIDKAKGDARTPLLDELATSLQAHMRLEEEVFYPAMEPVTGAEKVQGGVKEHELARKALQDAMALAPDEPGFAGALEAVKAGIEHHVQEEEGEVFPQMRSKGQETLAEMATRFMHKRMELGLPMDAGALEQAMSKNELMTEARSAEVSGAASMSKTELAKALADKMASM